MENCLVTVFKSIINNDNLMRLGEFAFVPVAANGNIQFGSKNGDSVTVRLIGDGYLSTTAQGNEGKEITLDGPAKIIYFHVNSGSCKLFMQDNYKLTHFNAISGTGIDIGILKYRNFEQVVLTSLSYGSLDGNGLCKKVTNSFTAAGNKDIHINTNVFAGNTGMKQCKIYGTSSYGSILNFASATALTTLWLADTDITGTLESLLEAWAGNKSSSCSIDIFISKITFGGILATSHPWTVSFSGNGVLVKDGNNTIGEYDGSEWTYYLNN